jgi:hypothetical protein
MSEGISLSVFLASTVISTLIVAHKSKNRSTSPRRRRLTKLQTQFEDGQLLRQILAQLVPYQPNPCTKNKKIKQGRFEFERAQE